MSADDRWNHPKNVDDFWRCSSFSRLLASPAIDGVHDFTPFAMWYANEDASLSVHQHHNHRARRIPASSVTRMSHSDVRSSRYKREVVWGEFMLNDCQQRDECERKKSPSPGSIGIVWGKPSRRRKAIFHTSTIFHPSKLQTTKRATKSKGKKKTFRAVSYVLKIIN